jgi:alpha-galactosidase
MTALPTGITAMLHLQASINRLLVEAYMERSRRKLVQAVLLDPTVSSYHQAVAMIGELCERQKEILPALHW